METKEKTIPLPKERVKITEQIKQVKETAKKNLETDQATWKQILNVQRGLTPDGKKK